MARLKFSISLENLKILNFFNLWALRQRELPLRFESLGFVGAHISPKTQDWVLIGPAFRIGAAFRIARLAFIGVAFVPRGTAEWPARVGHVR